MPKYIKKVRTKTGKVRYIYTRSQNSHIRTASEEANRRGKKQTEYTRNLQKKLNKQAMMRKATEDAMKATIFLGLAYMKETGAMKDESYEDIYKHTIGAKKVTR